MNYAQALIEAAKACEAFGGRPTTVFMGPRQLARLQLEGRITFALDLVRVLRGAA